MPVVLGGCRQENTGWMEGERRSESEDSSEEIKGEYSGTPEFFVGLYGWRRCCLLFVLSLLLVTVTINFALSLWLLKGMQLSRSGMGTLRVLPGGVQLDGEAMVLDKLVTSKVNSRPGQPLRVESSKSVSLQTRKGEERPGKSRVTEKLVLEESGLEVMASSLKISDSRGKPLFAATESNAVTVGADSLRIAGEGGGLIQGSVQASKVRPRTGQNLSLESPTRSLSIFALEGITVESQGDVHASCRGDVKVESKREHVTLDAASIYLPHIKTATIPSPFSSKTPAPFSPSTVNNNWSGPRSSKSNGVTVFQVCMCDTGRLFLAPPGGPCVADESVCN